MTKSVCVHGVFRIGRKPWHENNKINISWIKIHYFLSRNTWTSEKIHLLVIFAYKVDACQCKVSISKDVSYFTAVIDNRMEGKGKKVLFRIKNVMKNVNSIIDRW